MKLTSIRAAVLGFPVWFVSSALAQNGGTTAAPLTSPPLPDASISLIRVIGALALVIGLFLGGVWMVRNWQRVGGKGGRLAKLNVLETRSLGNRHAIYVVGYDRERFLIASSPGGINLLSHLTASTDEESANPAGSSATPSFAQALTQVLKGK
jgi:flagellar biogenesis protein FliO